MDRSAEVEGLFEEYLAARERGEALGLDEFTARHPDHAKALRRLIAEHDLLERALADPTAGEADATDEASVDFAAAGPGDSAWEELIAQLQARGPAHTRYVFRGEIARGGMGVIQRVYDQDVRRPLAMKVILGQAEAAPTGQTPAVDDRTLGRFLEEAQVTGQLDHPGIVPVHEVGVDATGRVYFTMKLVKGEDLRAVIERVHDPADREWTLPRVLAVLQRVCEAMSYAHAKGVVHRDLKPGNVMVGRFGEVYVMDWGLARVLGREETKDIRLRMVGPTSATLDSARRDTAHDTPRDTPEDALLTMDGDVVGTPAFMSPEQAAGRLDLLGPRSDVYAAGAILYHVLAGHMPYVPRDAQVSNRTVLGLVLQGPPPRLAHEAPAAPPALVAICARAMARDPAGRYPSMVDLAADLRAFLEDRVVQAYRTGAVAELRAWVRRNRPLAASLAAVAAVMVLGTAGTLLYAARARDNEALARSSRQEAVAAAAEAERVADIAREGAEWNAYTSGLRTAQIPIARGDSLAAALALDQVPETHKTAWEWRLLRFTDDPLHPARTLKGHDSYVSALAFAPTGNLLASASFDHTVHLWNVTTGESMAVLQGHDSSVLSLAFFTDGTHVASGAGGGVVILWDVESRSRAATLQAYPPRPTDHPEEYSHSHDVYGLAFRADDTELVSMSRGGELKIWSVPDGELLAQMTGADMTFSISMDTSCSLLAAISNVDHWPRIWNLETRELVKNISFPDLSLGRYLSVVFHPVDGSLVVGTYDPAVQFWNRDHTEFKGTLLDRRTHGGAVRSIAFSPDATRVASAGRPSGTVWLWEPSRGEAILPLQTLEEEVGCVAFSPDGFHLVAGGESGSILCWDVPRVPIDQLRQRARAAQEAARLVEALRQRPDILLGADVAAALQLDPPDDSLVAAEALHLASLLEEDPDQLLEQARQILYESMQRLGAQYVDLQSRGEHVPDELLQRIVRRLLQREIPPADALDAVRLVQRALELTKVDQADQRHWLLGEALYHSGRYEEATGALQREIDAIRAMDASPINANAAPINLYLGFMIMSEHRLGSAERAAELLGSLESLVAKQIEAVAAMDVVTAAKLGYPPERWAQALLNEVRSLVESENGE